MPATLHNTAGGLWGEQPAGTVVKYALDWPLEAATIASAAWVALPATTPPLLISGMEHDATQARATISGGVAGSWYGVTCTVTTSAGETRAQSFMLRIAGSLPATGTSSLFPFPPAAVADIRRDRLVKLAQSHLAGITITDDEAWTKLRSAEAEAERALRAWLTPREILPNHPEYDAEAAAIAATGQPVHREPGYDWSPSMVRGDKWGMVELRHRPVTRINWARFSYPSPLVGIAELPPEWWRIDNRAGTAQLVWNSSPNTFALNSFVMSALAAGRTVPFMLHLSYRAGIENVRDAYPDLAPLVQRLAAINIVEDLLLPQSGSISADGLSRSLSMEVAKHREEAEAKLAKMREAASGIRFMVV